MEIILLATQLVEELWILFVALIDNVFITFELARNATRNARFFKVKLRIETQFLFLQKCFKFILKKIHFRPPTAIIFIINVLVEFFPAKAAFVSALI